VKGSFENGRPRAVQEKALAGWQGYGYR